MFLGIFSMSQGRIAAEIEARAVAYNFKTQKKAVWPTELLDKVKEVEAAVGNVVHVHVKGHRDTRHA